MRLSDFDYVLPEAAIAQQPIEPRDAARLLIDEGAGVRHGHIGDLVGLVGPGDVVVVNDTKVIPARLALRKDTGGAVEVLLLEQIGDHWEALVRPSRRVPPGARFVAGPDLTVEVGADLGEGRREVRLLTDDVEGALAVHGQMPLPPYLDTVLDDPGRYQTVYADRPASAAAPTAGLHITDELLADLRSAGAMVHTVELVVGLDTFRPIAVEDLADHEMHSERYRVPPATMDACQAADRVIAIGTTTVRALESAAASGALTGRTELFIQRGFEFAVVDLLLTNFHLPKSSLLVMIDAFVGPRWRELYESALDEGYRFLSFGDAMLLRRSEPQT